MQSGSTFIGTIIPLCAWKIFLLTMDSLDLQKTVLVKGTVLISANLTGPSTSSCCFISSDIEDAANLCRFSIEIIKAELTFVEYLNVVVLCFIM